MKNIYKILIVVVIVLVVGAVLWHYYGFDNWSKAQTAISSCQAKSVVQKKGKVAEINLKDGKILKVLEPKDNAAFDLVSASVAKCGGVMETNNFK